MHDVRAALRQSELALSAALRAVQAAVDALPDSEPVPAADRPLTASDCAALWNCSARHFRDRIAKLPGFPAPIRGTSLAWIADEVREFQRMHRGR